MVFVNGVDDPACNYNNNIKEKILKANTPLQFMRSGVW